MRALQVLICDIRYQFRYGFYFLYTVIAMVYIAILFFLPPALQKPAAALIILTDPATLGFFFVGAMVLLERDEGLHSYYSVTPATVQEYILAKAISLALISVLSVTVIAAIVFGREIHYPILISGLLFGTPAFTLTGLTVGTAARSVNQYFVYSIPAGILLLAPSLAALTNHYHIISEVFPATQLLRIIQSSLAIPVPIHPFISLCGLLIWSGLAIIASGQIYSRYLHKGGI